MMQKNHEISHAKSWIHKLAAMDAHPKLTGILQSSRIMTQQYAAFCRLHNLMAFTYSQNGHQQLLADTLAASGCDTLICDQRHYPALWYMLHQINRPMLIILNQEMWTPDWCWQFDHHQFLCQQDLL
ncbi:hypothetical protein L6J37_16755 [Photobacterium sp. WH77]|nr:MULTISPECIES: hypothetical protein [unclassified Photobacterium]MBV7261018.1 hypothetical protein [Photobacterium sp. WH24]MCG2838484.1 hypothetical protein [Photobacterium sp. WH77]